MARLQQFEHFVEQAALRHIGQQRQALLERRGRRLVDLEAQRGQLGRKTYGADDAYWILTVAMRCVPNHADNALSGIGHTLVVIDHNLAFRIVVHGVDRKVAPRRILILTAPDIVAQHPARSVNRMLHASQRMPAGLLIATDLFSRSRVEIRAKRRNFDHLVLAPSPEHHVHDAKAPADDKRPPEQALDFFGCGVGRYVKILGFEPGQQVPHRASHNVGLKTGFPERTRHIGRTFVNQRRVDPVYGNRNLDALAQRRFAIFGHRFAKKFVE